MKYGKNGGMVERPRGLPRDLGLGIRRDEIAELNSVEISRNDIAETCQQ